MSTRRLFWIALVVVAAGALAAFAFLAPSRAAARQTLPPSPAPAAAGAPAAPPSPPATVDPAAYDAKMLALANRKPPKPKPVAQPLPAGRSGRHARGARAEAGRGNRAEIATKPAPPPPPPLWPVHAVYPNAGAILPFHRIVAYYGNFSSTQMGILGQYPPADVIARLRQVVADWTGADPSTPVIPALDYIATTAQAAPGKDGKYRLRMPASQLDKALHMADQIHGLVFYDVQPGWSNLAAELPPLESYMKQANVELALDPEFALVPGRRPGAWRGTMSAAQINYAAAWLAKIVDDNHLPPKILVVHRFTQAMVTDYRDIRPLPQVQIVMDMDGFGSPSMKTSAYRDFIEKQPVQFTGFKLFYHNDVKWGRRMMTPAEILALSPQPSYIVYQ